MSFKFSSLFFFCHRDLSRPSLVVRFGAFFFPFRAATLGPWPTGLRLVDGSSSLSPANFVALTDVPGMDAHRRRLKNFTFRLSFFAAQSVNIITERVFAAKAVLSFFWLASTHEGSRTRLSCHFESAHESELSSQRPKKTL